MSIVMEKTLGGPFVPYAEKKVMGGKAGAIAFDGRPLRRTLYVQMCYKIHRERRTRYDDGRNRSLHSLASPHASTAEVAWGSVSPEPVGRRFSAHRRACDEGTASMVVA